VAQKVQQFLGTIKGYWQTGWTNMMHILQDAWGKILSFLGGLKDKIGGLVHDRVVQPIINEWNVVKTFLKNAGENLMKMIGDSIKNGAHWVADAAKNALGGIASFLGFHSPAPKVPESAYWGANLVKMFAHSMQTQMPVAVNAARSVMTGVQQAFSGMASSANMPGGTGVSSSANSAASGFAGMAGAGGGIVNNTNHFHFDNVRSSDEIVKAIRQVQQDDYRKGRRAGGYQGNRAGI
jgi:hypothetical protein